MAELNLSDLVIGVRNRSDKSNENRYTDTILNSYINSGILEIRNLIISHAPDLLLESESTATDGTADFDLPSDFFVLRAVDIEIDSNNIITCSPSSLQERNRFNQTIYPWATDRSTPYVYNIRGSEIIISPTPTTGYTLKVWYIATHTNLRDGYAGDTFNFYNGFEEYVYAAVGEKLAVMDEEDTTPFRIAKGEWRAQIITSLRQLHNSGPPRTAINYKRINDPFYSRFR